MASIWESGDDLFRGRFISTYWNCIFKFHQQLLHFIRLYSMSHTFSNKRKLNDEEEELVRKRIEDGEKVVNYLGQIICMSFK